MALENIIGETYRHQPHYFLNHFCLKILKSSVTVIPEGNKRCHRRVTSGPMQNLVSTEKKKKFKEGVTVF